jgi:hypothetical protein
MSASQPVFSVTLPKSVANGRFLTIDGDDLAKSTKSTKLSNFVNIGFDQQEYPVTKSEQIVCVKI